MPGSDQSRIYVTSHSEFSALHARDIQKILRDRLILVHGNPLDYNYRWDLESFGRVYDVDKTTTVQGEISVSYETCSISNFVQFQQNFIPTSLIFGITRGLCEIFII